MKVYHYKIQWLFNPETEIKDFNSIIKILGANNLDMILFRDRELKVIAKYTSMKKYSIETASQKIIEAVTYFLKKNKNVQWIEIVKN